MSKVKNESAEPENSVDLLEIIKQLLASDEQAVDASDKTKLRYAL